MYYCFLITFFSRHLITNCVKFQFFKFDQIWEKNNTEISHWMETVIFRPALIKTILFEMKQRKPPNIRFFKTILKEFQNNAQGKHKSIQHGLYSTILINVAIYVLFFNK